MGKKALVIVSFGTSYEEAVCAIENVERICQQAYPDYDFYRAWTSGMIIRKLARTKNMVIYNPEEVFEKLAQEGYEEVLCQPSHVIPGIENDKMIEMAAKYADRIPNIQIGAPLLWKEEDYYKVAQIILDELDKPLAEDEALVLMGHGSDHYANSAYSQLQNIFRSMGHENVFVGTVEGFPDIEYVISRLNRKEIKKTISMPLMIVAGDHARNDLAGDEEDSWKSILISNGYEPSFILKGLGEIDAIGELFVEHLSNAESLSKGEIMPGKLYGIGVGPGDPELLTLKAKRLIEECDIVAVPVKKVGEYSVALEIAKGAMDIPQDKIVEILFTMNKDKSKREACRQEAAGEIKKYLDEGKNIAMLALGDIAIYSTYAYVHRILQKDGYDVQMVSGIPSFCAGASTANVSIIEGNEGFGVLPGLKGIDQVEKALEVFDNLVIMKAGSHVKEIYDLLASKGIEDNALMISNVGLPGEYVGPFIRDREYGYFTTLLIKTAGL